MSASSWGCELKWICNQNRERRWSCQPLREAVSWNKTVTGEPERHRSQPLREAVSWNPSLSFYQFPLVVSLFVRLWVEIRCWRKSDIEIRVSLFVRLWVEIACKHWFQLDISRQPLREAVSWNTVFVIERNFSWSQPLREAVSWNIKLCYWHHY